MGDGAYTKASNATPSLLSDKKHQLLSDAPSYLSDIPGINESSQSRDVGSTPTPAYIAEESKSSMDILRQLSLVGDASSILHEADPREQHPGLHLSRRIISAAFCIPYKLSFRSGSDWVRLPFTFELQFLRLPPFFFFFFFFWRFQCICLEADEFIFKGSQTSSRHFCSVRFLGTSRIG